MANKIGEILDDAIATFWPKRGFERSLNRNRMALQKEHSRSYEAANRGRRASSWRSHATLSADLVIAKDLKDLVLRARELAINNPYAKKAPYVIANNIVGTGIVATISIPDKIVNGKIVKAKRKDELQKIFTQGWRDFAGSVSADFEGNLNFYGLQHLAVRTKVISGEVLALRKRVKESVNKYGFQILLVESDYIDTTKGTLRTETGGYIFRGIEYDSEGRKIRYWIYDRHPSEGNAKSYAWNAEDVVHLYEVDRPGQGRGVPDAAATSVAQKDLADYMDAERVAKKGAACFAGIIQTAERPDGEDEERDALETLEPGMIQYLNPGETIHFPTLPQNPGLNEFVKVQLRSIAAGYLMPYENLTGDLSNVTFVSGRFGQMDFKKQVEHWQHNTFIPQFCEKIFAWFVEGAKIAFGLPDDVEVKATWTAPRWTMIDPTKEILAMKEEVRAGFSTWEEKVRENGYDPEEVLRQMIANQQAFEKANLTPSSNPYFELKAKVSMNHGKETETPNSDE